MIKDSELIIYAKDYNDLLCNKSWVTYVQKQKCDIFGIARNLEPVECDELNRLINESEFIRLGNPLTRKYSFDFNMVLDQVFDVLPSEVPLANLFFESYTPTLDVGAWTSTYNNFNYYGSTHEDSMHKISSDIPFANMLDMRLIAWICWTIHECIDPVNRHKWQRALANKYKENVYGHLDNNTKSLIKTKYNDDLDRLLDPKHLQKLGIKCSATLKYSIEKYIHFKEHSIITWKNFKYKLSPFICGGYYGCKCNPGFYRLSMSLPITREMDNQSGDNLYRDIIYNEKHIADYGINPDMSHKSVGTVSRFRVATTYVYNRVEDVLFKILLKFDRQVHLEAIMYDYFSILISKDLEPLQVINFINEQLQRPIGDNLDTSLYKLGYRWIQVTHPDKTEPETLREKPESVITLGSQGEVEAQYKEIINSLNQFIS